MEHLDVLKEATPFLTVVVALVAVFLGPTLAARAARRQIVAPMRQIWINTVRDSVAELLSTVYSITIGNDSGSILYEGVEDNELHRKLLYLEQKLVLMLNPNEELHQTLIESVDQLGRIAYSGPDDADDVGALMGDIRRTTQNILKAEWVRVKEGGL
ncbi:MAG: hypothetical protein FHP94_01395 [Denitromonas halophila]|nr:MAG: hypothetical protein FHP94_01395 [Denitromonas halophila]TVT70648.1 MAG: hypothetical protein FHP93_11530 [Denitromonas halophila]